MTNKAEDASAVAKRLKSIVDYVRDCQVRVGKGEIMADTISDFCQEGR